MPTDDKLLTLMQWLSPSFPISSFAYSHGLETAVADSWVRPDSLRDWLKGILIEGTGRADAIWLRLAHQADGNDALVRLNDEARAFQPARHRLRETEKQGAMFAQTVNQVWGGDLPDLTLPLAVGAAARQHAIDIEQVVPLFLHSFISNLVAASQRLMPLGQTEGQRILAHLQPTCRRVANATRGATIDDISSIAFLSDITAMRHESLQPRLFHS